MITKESSFVPKVLHQIVGKKTTAQIDKCLQSWHAIKKSGYEIRIWDDNLIEEFLIESYPFALNAFKNARNHGEAADIARYLIIHHFGGHYMDWDVELLSSDKYLELIDKNPNGFLVIDPVNDTLASETFAARPNEPYLLSLCKDIVEIYNSGKRELLNTPAYSGPFRMRDTLKTHANSSQSIIEVKDIMAYDYWEIREMPEKDITQPLIHYWMHTWMQ
jgi:mannosyltransferase OCH1-like enzyme